MPYIVVAYDISDDRRRRVAAEKLCALGFHRVQKSVYIARGSSTLAKEVYRALLRIIDSSRDSIMVITVSSECVEKALIHGASIDIGGEGSLII